LHEFPQGENPVADHGDHDGSRSSSKKTTVLHDVSDYAMMALDETVIALLINFFQVLDRWDREAKPKC